MIETLNRAFMYGESVFTTLRVVDGLMHNFDHHFERLRKGVEFVYGPFTEGEDWTALFRNRLETRCALETGDKILRITVYQEQARGLSRNGILSIADLRINFQSSPLDLQHLSTQRTLRLRTCPVVSRPLWWPGFLKSGDYLGSILAQKVYLKPEDDDLLFVSRDDTVLESSVANIFFVRHNKLYTAPTGPNVLEGVMRRKVIEVACEYFDEFHEVETTLEQAFKADAVFGSNSIRGLFLISHVDDTEFVFSREFLLKFDVLSKQVLK
ncbi:MAG TPA: aminotransferase class IV [Bacteriovoracaceae bacterium]|nr:aminotransferase class IV [Bacteriovoracaceae bacterium]